MTLDYSLLSVLTSHDICSPEWLTHGDLLEAFLPIPWFSLQNAVSSPSRSQTSRHHQLRHYISTADPDIIYVVANKVVHSIHVKSQKWDTIERIPFEPKCLAASYGWIVVGGSDNGECAFIRLPGRESPVLNDMRLDTADVDAALPIELDSDTRTLPTEDASTEQQRTSNISSSRSDLPDFFTKALTGSIVNSVTIHRLPGEDSLGFAHEDLAIFSNNDKTVKIYSLTRCKLIETKHHRKCMNYAVISPDSSLLAAVGDENFAYFYRITRDLTTVDYGERGERLSGWKWEKCCRIELALSADLDATSGFDDGSCFTIAFSPSSRLCAIGSQSGIISIYDVETISKSSGEDFDARLTLFRSSQPDSAGAVRSMAFSPEPWDLLVWVEDTGRFGVVDIRSGFFRRQVVNLDRDDPNLEKVRTTFNSPFLSRSESGDNEFGMRDESDSFQEAILDLLSGTSLIGFNAETDRISSLRESVQGLTERERQIIEYLNTARSSSGRESDAGDRTPSTDSHSRQRATASSLGGTGAAAADVAHPLSRATSPFRSTDAALHELFREHYLGRVGSTERNFGQRRRASIVISQPGQVAGPLSNAQSSDDNNPAAADIQLRLRWTTSPMDMQAAENYSHSNDASIENELSTNESSTDNGQGNAGIGTELWNMAFSREAVPTEAWQLSQRSRSIPRRIMRPGTTTENRYDAQRATAAELRASVAAERLRRQRLAANDTRSPRWIRHILSNDPAERHFGYMPQNQDPADTAGVGWGADGRSLYIGTVEGIFEFQINVQDRKSFPVFYKPCSDRMSVHDDSDCFAMVVDILSSRLAQLQLNADKLDAAVYDARLIDQEEGVMDTLPSRKKVRHNEEDLKAELENEFLTPSPQFSPDWLNRLQRRWDVSIDYQDIFEIAPTQTRTIIRFNREGLEGRVTAYHEVTVPASSATAKNSTSLLRRPAARADFVRGAAGFFPFAPGGLDGVEAIAEMESEMQANEQQRRGTKNQGLDRIINFGSEGGLLEVPPGFSRGLQMKKPESKDAEEDDQEVERTLEREDEGVKVDRPEVDRNAEEYREDEDKVPSEDEEEEEEEDIDSLLPVEFPAFEPRSQLLAATAKKGGREWAHVVDINKEISNFHDLVPDMAREWPFELDTFQKEAVYHLENGDSVFVAAHTSAGKTVVAEYAIALAAKHMTKAIYTSPIKALSNQKFRDFRETFDDVGILTGDVQISPESSCLIMTTEILRSMLYRGADLIRDVEFVIFDEVHYVNDMERGVVWEEVIIMLPEHVTLILLSATVPNTYEFASWVGRTKKKDIYVISTPKRPVPLEHYLWSGKSMHKIVDSNKKFIEKGWKEADDILSGRDKLKAQKAAEAQAQSLASKRGAPQGRGRGGQQQINARGGGPRGGGQGQGRGRGQPANRGTGNIARTGRGGGRTTAAQDRNVWVHLVQHLRKENLLPACVFVFSKKRCEENANSLSNQDFCTAAEKSAIHMIIEKSLVRLKPEDRVLPQILRLRELLSRGVAVHHGGLLPIMKEIVEILFARTLVKVLFATETFAMGLNLPTRTVVFSGFRKHDGKNFRDLLPGEYTQMAGRAGRRGLDTVGYVIIVTSGRDEAPPAAALRRMMLGDPTKLRSQFRLTYNMILNLLRVEALKIEEMIKRSFSENATQALLPEHEKQVQLSEASLSKIKREPCSYCDDDLAVCHQASVEYEKLTRDLHLGLISSPVGKRLFMIKRLVVYRKDGIRTAGILLREGVAAGAEPNIHVLEIGAVSDKRHPSDILPFLPTFRHFFRNLPTNTAEMSLTITQVALGDVECVTNTIVKFTAPIWYLNIKKEAKIFADKQLLNYCVSWETSSWDELDWDRVKELQVREILNKRQSQAAIAQSCHCLSCPDFLKHFEMQHDEWQVKENISQLRQLMSDQNLQLLPDYEQRVEVLKELGFVDAESRVLLKGKVACEIHSADELVLTELILENVLAEYEPEEIVALLSAFVFQEKTENEPTLTARLEKGKEAIIRIADKVNDFQILHQVILSSEDSNDFTSKPRFGLMEVVYEWAKGMSFNRITDLTDVMEGTIVRTITRLDETCREVKNAAKLVGDPTLYLKMQQAQEMIKRDVIFAASLYM
ncbi:hypothetical protein UA08_02605 [Talaromyces atroroseus]|uniref:Antiviral helicase SKI2 n=1 Tax=Talaromyces atroroseus TaxID=1441469 RepID=A0A225AK48_TALAT|nr:hypothetical protein UA08_02605 [Talaromyces atroroseus]OKL61921.1 hypothetical protein UA08_02605 [Talaromyces atroroseus]